MGSLLRTLLSPITMVLRALLTPAVLMVLALLTLAVLVWWIGPVVRVGDVTPLAGVGVRATLIAVLALLMPLIIIGGIVLGVFTPTESAGIAVAYALFLGGLVYRELSWRSIVASFCDAAISSSACSGLESFSIR